MPSDVEREEVEGEHRWAACTGECGSEFGRGIVLTADTPSSRLPPKPDRKNTGAYSKPKSEAVIRVFERVRLPLSLRGIGLFQTNDRQPHTSAVISPSVAQPWGKALPRVLFGAALLSAIG
jgi:hypothetical protein